MVKCAFDLASSSDEEDDEEENGRVADSPEQEIFDTWMERASSFNNVVKRFSKLCDKFTFIENRELFFDINSYLNNLQV